MLFRSSNLAAGKNFRRRLIARRTNRIGWKRRGWRHIKTFQVDDQVRGIHTRRGWAIYVGGRGLKSTIIGEAVIQSVTFEGEPAAAGMGAVVRSEERRVGKEGKHRGSPEHYKK